jgi:hypothetical protein
VGDGIKALRLTEMASETRYRRDALAETRLFSIFDTHLRPNRLPPAALYPSIVQFSQEIWVALIVR